MTVSTPPCGLGSIPLRSIPGCEGGPHRVQLSRAKGWRMPDNTVKVDRSSSWGNPYRVGDVLDYGPYAGTEVLDVQHAVDIFREWALEALAGRAMPQASGAPAPDAATCNSALEELRGKNLACWCRLDQPCHADVLLEIANRPEPNLGGNEGRQPEVTPKEPIHE